MEDVLVPNVMDYITDNFKLALDYYFPDPLLPDFAERTMGQIERKQFPLLAIGPIGNPAVESEDSARFTQPITIAMYLGVVADTSDAVTILIMQYVKVMHAVLANATKSSLFAGYETHVFGFSLNAEHFYGAIRSNNSRLFRDATIQLTINFESR